MTAIRSNRVVTPDGVGPATIIVDAEQITSVVRGDTPSVDGPVTDFGDLVIMPGLVDSHVHVNEPGRTEWEGFDTATRAAAAGGITTIVDMPLNSIPPVTTVMGLEAKTEAMARKCHVDVALWGGVIPDNLEELSLLVERGVRGFKCFLVDSGVGEFPAVSQKELRIAAERLARLGVPLLVHAELPGPIEKAQSTVAKMDPRQYQTYLASRPAEAEVEAIALLENVCRETRARIHIVHLSAAGALDIVRRAQQEGLPLSAETTPHYLHLEAEQVPAGQTEFKCAPPIREHSNRERLWEGLRDGVIEMIVSDHSPCTPELKRGHFHESWGGIASLQLVLPIVWTEAQRRGHDLATVSRWLSSAPAVLAGLSRKGTIAAGSDADFVVWAPDETLKVTPRMIEHRHKITPYAGETLRGVVHATWLRGSPIFERGRHGSERRGRWLH